MLDAFNRYMTATATKYNSGIKLDSLYEALALNNIMLIEPGNSFGVDEENWNNYINVPVSNVTLPAVPEATNDIIDTIIRRYFVEKENLCNIQATFSLDVSAEIKLCLSILTNVDINKKIRDSDDGKEEDMFINNYVDSIFLNPLFNCIDDNIKLHGNGHPLKESRHRKLKQAKERGEKAKHCKGRIPDRSMELCITKKVSYHVFICEVKVKSASKKHPDIFKLGSILKDTVEQGAMRLYCCWLVNKRCILHNLLFVFTVS